MMNQNRERRELPTKNQLILYLVHPILCQAAFQLHQIHILIESYVMSLIWIVVNSLKIYVTHPPQLHKIQVL